MSYYYHIEEDVVEKGKALSQFLDTMNHYKQLGVPIKIVSGGIAETKFKLQVGAYCTQCFGTQQGYELAKRMIEGWGEEYLAAMQTLLTSIKYCLLENGELISCQSLDSFMDKNAFSLDLHRVWINHGYVPTGENRHYEINLSRLTPNNLYDISRMLLVVLDRYIKADTVSQEHFVDIKAFEETFLRDLGMWTKLYVDPLEYPEQDLNLEKESNLFSVITENLNLEEVYQYAI